MSQFRIKNGLIIDNGGIAVTGSISSTAGITGSFSGSIAGFPTDVAAFSSSLSSRIASNEAKTGSYATTGSNQFNGSQTVTGSLTATGTIVAQTLVVQTITSSVEFVTGSNRFGTTTGNTHEFTGSLLVSGSQTVTGNATFSNDLYVVESGNALLRVQASTNTTPVTDIELMRGTNTTWGADGYGDYRFRNSGGDLTIQYGDTGVTSDRLIINSSGNLGLGVTPSAWDLGKAIEVGNIGNSVWGVSATQFNILQNAYYSGGYKYASSNPASYYQQASGKHIWNIAPSGTAGNAITFTQAMTLDTSGRLGIGITAPNRLLTLYNSIVPVLQLVNSTTGTTANDGLLIYQNDVNSVIENQESGYLSFLTSATERMRITSTGLVAIGNTSPSGNGASAVLDIGNGSGGTLNLRDTNTGIAAEGFHQIYGGDNRMYLYAGGSGASAYMQFYTNDSERMRITSAGNVGIGNTVPQARLDLGGSYGASGEKFFIYNDNSSSALAGTKVGFYMDRFSLSNNSTFVFPTSTGAPGSYIIASKDTSSTTLVARMTVLGESGNVGIGTTSPSNPENFTRVLNISSTNAALVLSNTSGTTKNWSLGAYEDGSFRIVDSNSQRFKIDSVGRISGTVNTINGQFQLFQTDAAYSTDAMMYLMNNRNATSGYNFAKFFSGYPDNTSDIEFAFRGDGIGYSDGGWTTPASDYAEYFESTDGTALQIGTTVVLENGKIRQATESDTNIIGVIRPKNASLFLGNNAEHKWNQKYLKDDFGAYILDTEGMRTLNPDYDPDIEYIPREKRDEWNIVGLVGQVPTLKSQPKNPNWVKMHDVSDTVEMWLIK
jgi:hypothetical protein